MEEVDGGIVWKRLMEVMKVPDKRAKGRGSGELYNANSSRNAEV